jgi:hypothetical protein
MKWACRNSGVMVAFAWVDFEPAWIEFWSFDAVLVVGKIVLHHYVWDVNVSGFRIQRRHWLTIRQSRISIVQLNDLASSPVFPEMLDKSIYSLLYHGLKQPRPLHRKELNSKLLSSYGEACDPLCSKYYAVSQIVLPPIPTSERSCHLSTKFHSIRHR